MASIKGRIKDAKRDIDDAERRIKHTQDRYRDLRAAGKRVDEDTDELQKRLREARDERNENRKRLVAVRDKLEEAQRDGVEEDEVDEVKALEARKENLVDENEELTALIDRTLPKLDDAVKDRKAKARLREEFADELEQAKKKKEANQKQLKQLRKEQERKKDAKSNIGSKYFVASEFNCRAGGPVPEYMYDDLGALCDRVLDKMRERFGPAHVNSGHRWESYNRAIGGASLSYHVYEQRKADPAADMTFANGSPSDWAAFARSLGVGGVGQYSTFVHVDTGPVRSWSG